MENEIINTYLDLLGVDKKEFWNKYNAFVDEKKSAKPKKKVEKKEEVKEDKPTEPCVCSTNPAKEPCSCKPRVPKVEEGTWTNSDVYKICNNSYILRHHVNGFNVKGESLDLDFEYYDKTENGFFPGINEKQLLLVLYDRFKNEPKKQELIEKILYM